MNAAAPTLWTFWRSSAAYRVRIALNLKGIGRNEIAVNLRTGTQRAPDFTRRNAQRLVPYFEDDRVSLAQSLAIIEYLDVTHPEPPLLGRDEVEAARIRQFALAIACDIHPLNNLRVLDRLRSAFAADEASVTAWARGWIEEGLAALEAWTPAGSAFCVGANVSLADVCLVPQLYSARRFGVDLVPFPKLSAIDARVAALPPFAGAAPEQQSDAVAS